MAINIYSNLLGTAEARSINLPLTTGMANISHIITIWAVAPHLIDGSLVVIRVHDISNKSKVYGIWRTIAVDLGRRDMPF